MPTSAYVIGPLVVLLTAVFAIAYHFVPLYRAYQATDAFKRANGIRREDARLRSELRVAETPPAGVPAEAIRADGYRDCLRGVSIDALKSHPGVGGVTVQRLADAGYRTLFDADGRLTQPTFHVPGIGPSRVGEVVAAARAELRKQRQVFDDGANPFARQAEAEIRRLAAEYDARVAENKGRQKSALASLARLEPQRTAVDKVTFWAYIRHRHAHPDQPWLCDSALIAPILRRSGFGFVCWDQSWPCDPALTLPMVSSTPPQALARPVVEPLAIPDATPRLPASVEAIATLLYGVARADGRLAAAERAAVRRGLAKFFESDSVLVRYIDPALERLAAAPLDIDAALRFAGTLARHDRDLLRQCADDVGGATGTRHAAKAQMIERLRQALAVPGEARVPPSVSNPAELRSNDLLDGLFGGPEPAPSIPQPVAAGEGLRDNTLLDDVFGGR